MSKNIHSKQQAKMKPKVEPSKRTSSTSSSSDPKKSSSKLTSTTRTASTSKDEEKKKTLATRTPAQSTSVKRVTKASVTKPPAVKAPLSRSSSTTTTIKSKTKPEPTTSEKRQTSNIKPRLISEKRIQPSKSKQTPSTSKPIVTGKPNAVMTTVHNVTVSSPPPKRRDVPIETIAEKDESRPHKKSPKEVVVPKDTASKLKPVLNKPLKGEVPAKVKEPVAFEVVFDEDQQQPSAKKRKSPVPSDSGPDYDDDFESYESDFETGSSSAEIASGSSSSSESSPQDTSDSSPAAKENDSEPEGPSEDEDESELTQFPITVIHRDKEQERKLDSGNYDLHSKKRRAIDTFDSLDTLANYEQLDSGISYENSIATASFEPGSVVYGGYVGFYARPRTTKRGVEIMSKIQFDMITFSLFELKPIVYDSYMRMFGSLNTVQSATQTLEDRMDSECQTDEGELRSVWTQHPPQYDLTTAQNSLGTSNCTGELQSNDQNKTAPSADPFDNTIKALSKLRQETAHPLHILRHKPINFERLNSFLNRSFILVSRILSSNAVNLHLNTTELPALSKGFIKLNTRLLNALKVVRVFANVKFDLVLTVHESIANVYQNDFSNLIMVWDSGDASKPIRLLSTWSEVCQVEICNESSDIIVCGLRDGSVAMWDLRETYSFCSKLDGYLSHFAATHSIAPTWGGTDIRSFDLGAVIDVKSFRSSAKTLRSVETFKTVQFASLNETGILAIWTLVDTGVRNYKISQGPDSKFEYNSPWARVKLTQSAICDLREYLELGAIRPKSSFERTKMNFQMEIFEDEILKELADTRLDIKQGLQGLRFINLDCGTDLIFVGTNRNFIISCSKTLKRERFRKINIVDGGFLFPTAIKLLQNENYLAVGLSNGSVLLLNCNQEQTSKDAQLRVQSAEHQQATPATRGNEFEFEIGKSCAIQNIIRNERLPPGSRIVEQDFRPNTAALVEATRAGGKKPFEQRLFDEQVLLNGSVLRKDLIQKLEVSADGWTLFALSNMDVRAYDFYAEKEVPFSVDAAAGRKIMEIAVSRGYGEEKKLILLNQPNDVEVHLLK